MRTHLPRRDRKKQLQPPQDSHRIGRATQENNTRIASEFAETHRVCQRTFANERMKKIEHITESLFLHQGTDRYSQSTSPRPQSSPTHNLSDGWHIGFRKKTNAPNFQSAMYIHITYSFPLQEHPIAPVATNPANRTCQIKSFLVIHLHQNLRHFTQNNAKPVPMTNVKKDDWVHHYR